MSRTPQQEQLRHDLHMAVLIAHKKGLSWKRAHEALAEVARDTWSRHQDMLQLFPENARHSAKSSERKLERKCPKRA